MGFREGDEGLGGYATIHKVLLRNWALQSAYLYFSSRIALILKKIDIQVKDIPGHEEVELVRRFGNET